MEFNEARWSSPYETNHQLTNYTQNCTMGCKCMGLECGDVGIARVKLFGSCGYEECGYRGCFVGRILGDGN